MDDIEADVLIVGAGIAGSALACALRDSGLRVVLIDKSDQPLDTARGDHLQPRSCEIFERWGVLQDFFEKGAEKRAGAIWYTPTGEVILRSSVAELDIPHPYFAFINHEDIATVLLSSALSSGNTDVIRPIRNWWLENDNDQRYTIKVGLPDAADLRIHARVIVGADGRVSRTRNTFGIESKSHQYARGMAVFFARQRGQNPENFVQAYSGESITSVIPRTGGTCKIGIPVPSSEASAWRGRDPHEVATQLEMRVPALQIGDLHFGDIYAPVYLHANRWTQKGVVLIGDACHAMHPARSQGMNVSIRCIDVLATKLSDMGSAASRAEVEWALAEYERQVRKPTMALLASNHQRGLEMDVPQADGRDKLEAQLRYVQANAKALREYSTAAAGYEV